ncbi:MAG: 3-phosphoshikimate 1-carboxyvinyltransferase [Acidobacteriota bacterium]
MGRQVHPVGRVLGRLRVPGDKSISHRLLMLGAVAEGDTVITGLATGDDCRSTRSCLRALGVQITERDRNGVSVVTVAGRGRRGLAPPGAPLDAGNSGTTARLLMGMIAGHPLTATIVGDGSLRRRPMMRVIEPLTQMGAAIDATDGRLPATVAGGALRGIDFAPCVASAQVKSAVLLAGLRAEGTTRVREAHATRDHTEIALEQFGVEVARDGLSVALAGGQSLRATQVSVPGDPSSAAFWAAAAAGIPGSHVTVEDVCLNPTRTGFLRILERMGAHVETIRRDEGIGEPCGTLIVSYGEMKPIGVADADVPGVIDELPVLAALAALGAGMTVRGAAELRVKESDRISALVAGLRGLGAAAEELPDGFTVDGSRPLPGGVADAAGDHRLAMAFAIAALGARRPSTILGAEAVSVSYPGFFETLAVLDA